MARKPRQWLKLKLPVNEEYRLALDIIKGWALLKETPKHFAKAIRLYDSLLKGDLRLFLEFFPGLALSQVMSGQSLPVKLNKPLVIAQIDRAETEELSEALSLLGDLDI